jgi:predicted transcriptional regulator
MYDLYIMRRTQIYLDETQGERLASVADRSGMTMSAVIRQAIDSFLDRDDSEEARLDRFRAAVRGAAGSAPELPTGAEYVDGIRPDYSDRAAVIWGEGDDD